MWKSVLFLFVSSLAFATTDVQLRQVTQLEATDPYDAHLFHEGVLWVGRNRDPQGNFYRLEAYSPDGSQRIASAMIPHTLGYLSTLGTKAVAVGKSWKDSTGWRTHYTTAELKGNKLLVKTTTLPTWVQTEYYAGREGALFFTEMGSRAVLRATGSSVKAIPGEISGPGKMTLVGDILYIIERKSFMQGDENLVRFNIKTNQSERVFASDRNNLSNIAALPGTGRVALAETAADRVHILDPKAAGVLYSISVPDGPAALAGLGKCVLALSYFTRKLHVYDVSGPAAKEVDEWDLSGLGDDVKNVRVLEADPKSGRIYVRATFRPEFPGAKTGVWVAEQSGRKTFSQCSVKP